MTEADGQGLSTWSLISLEWTPLNSHLATPKPKMSANVQKYSSHNPQYSPFHDLNTKYHVENDHWFFNPQTDSKILTLFLDGCRTQTGSRWTTTGTDSTLWVFINYLWFLRILRNLIFRDIYWIMCMMTWSQLVDSLFIWSTPNVLIMPQLKNWWIEW